MLLSFVRASTLSVLWHLCHIVVSLDVDQSLVASTMKSGSLVRGPVGLTS